MGVKTVWYEDLFILSCLFLLFLAINIGLFIYNHRHPSLSSIPALSDKNITEHNSNETNTWKQGRVKFFEGLSMLDVKKLMGVRLASDAHLNKCFYDQAKIPDSFDVREKWPECKLPPFTESKECAGSYATVVASTLAEKRCLADPDNELFNLSSQELISCDINNKGCEGGSLNVALDYLERYGLCNQTCFPTKKAQTDKCSNMCKNAKKYRSGTYCVIFGIDGMKKEIQSNGPVVSVMEIYTDFLAYKSGIYRVSKDAQKFTNMHAVKVIGWGEEEEKGEKVGYWLIENTWGEDWGDKGVAKVAMGQDFFFEKYSYSILLKSQADDMERKYYKRNANVTEIENDNVNIENVTEKIEEKK